MAGTEPQTARVHGALPVSARRPRSRLLLLAAGALALLSVLLPSAAGALTRDQAAVHIAWDYWNRYAPSQVQDLQATCSADIVWIEWVSYYPGGGVAGASLNGCRTGYPYILVRTSLSSYKFLSVCKTVTHEYGHLIGFGHTTDKRSIMYGSDHLGEVPSAATRTRAEQMCRDLQSVYL
jgi:predicted Zn-dependent protease